MISIIGRFGSIGNHGESRIAGIDRQARAVSVPPLLASPVLVWKNWAINSGLLSDVWKQTYVSSVFEVVMYCQNTETGNEVLSSPVAHGGGALSLQYGIREKFQRLTKPRKGLTKVNGGGQSGDVPIAAPIWRRRNRVGNGRLGEWGSYIREYYEVRDEIILDLSTIVFSKGDPHWSYHRPIFAFHWRKVLEWTWVSMSAPFSGNWIHLYSLNRNEIEPFLYDQIAKNSKNIYQCRRMVNL